MIRLELDERQFARTAEILSVASNKAMGDVILQWSRIMVEDCIRLTPPMNYGTSLTESGQIQKKIGLKAAAAGVNKAFTTWKEKDEYAQGDRSLFAGIRRSMKRGSWDRVNRMTHRFHVKGVIPTASKALHQEQRRKGRVPRNQWPYIVASRKSINKVIRERQSEVGFAKSGWIPAAIALGSKLSGFAWVKGKGGEAYGGISRSNPKDPGITIWNGVPYVQEAGRERRIVQKAFQSVLIKMGTATEAILAKRMRRFA